MPTTPTGRIDLELDVEVSELSRSLSVTVEARDLLEVPLPLAVFLEESGVTDRTQIIRRATHSGDENRHGVAETRMVRDRSDLFALRIESGDVLRAAVEALWSGGS